MKKIVVRIITYNQEDVIARAIESILCQKNWGLYRVIISDDCSQDQTWEILKKYQEAYPNLIYIYRNEHNLGIYKNIAKADSYLPCDYDLFCGLAGDDVYCDGYFEAVQKLIEKNNVDTNKAIGVYSDWLSVEPGGKEIIHCQKVVQKGHSLTSLKLRGAISGRSLLMTKTVKDNYAPMIFGQGLALTEGNYDLQPHLIIKKAYYLPQTTTVYYSGLGISTKLGVSNSDYYTTQYKNMWQYYIDHYITTKKDLYFAKYQLCKSDFLISPTLSLYFKMLLFHKRGRLALCQGPIFKEIRLFASLFKYYLKHIKRNG